MTKKSALPTGIDKAAGLQIASNVVLLVSNDSESAQVWAYALRRMGLEVVLVSSAGEALLCWEHGRFDLTLIDVCGPELDGIDLARQLCAEAVNPVLLLMPSYDEVSILHAYRVGVDECVIKPVSPALFVAKVRAWLRRAWTVRAGALEGLCVGALRLIPMERAVLLPDGSSVKLTNLEFRVLHLLMSHPDRILPTEVIVERVWGYGGEDGALLKNVIYRLRRKLEPNPDHPRYIHTGPAGGYAFIP